MAAVPLGEVFVMLCDWRGKCIWASEGRLPAKVGEEVWAHLTDDSRMAARLALGQVVALREKQQLEVEERDGNGARYRAWLWPLDSPETAMCVLGVRTPRNLGLLTDRERRTLELLAQGTVTHRIAQQLDVSLSTVHTHLRHAREKLGLRNIEELISFAARYFFPLDRALDWQPAEGSAMRGARPKQSR